MSGPTRAVAWAGALALLACSWIVTSVTPEETSYTEPFRTETTLGETATTRTLTATISGVSRATTLVAGAWQGESSWIIVTASVAAVGEPRSLAYARLTLADGREYVPSERPPATLRNIALGPDVFRYGAIAFEVPATISGVAQLDLGTSYDPRGDALITTSIDLDAIAVADQATLEPAGWTP